jgi:hypothetical protein
MCRGRWKRSGPRHRDNDAGPANYSNKESPVDSMTKPEKTSKAEEVAEMGQQDLEKALQWKKQLLSQPRTITGIIKVQMSEAAEEIMDLKD